MYSETGEMGIGALIIMVSLIVVAAIVGAAIYRTLIENENKVGSTENTANPYSIGLFNIKKVYAIITQHTRGIGGLLIEAKLMPTIKTADLRYSVLTINNGRKIMRFFLSPNVSKNDDFYDALSKADSSHYSVYLLYASPKTPWDPENGSYIVCDDDIVAFVIGNITKTYDFYVPTIIEHHGPSHTTNDLRFEIQEDNTNIEIDTDGDGKYDEILSGNRGDVLHYNAFSLEPGAHFRSNKPIIVNYFYSMDDYGTYEDGAISYSLLPYNYWGLKYGIPVKYSYTYIFSAEGSNTVRVDTNGDGIPEYTKTLSSHSTWKLTNLPTGTQIWADKKINVVEINENNNWYDNTSAITLLPESELGSEYYVPKETNYNYQSSTDLTKVYIMAIKDGTKVYVDENRDGTPDYTYMLNAGERAIYNHPKMGAKIYANKDIYAIYQFDVYAQDPWASVYRHYTYAFSLLPQTFSTNEIHISYTAHLNNGHMPSYGSGDTISVVTTTNSNTIKMDYDSDGVVDRESTVNYGDVVYYGSEYTGNAKATIKSSGMLMYLSDIGWWDDISEHTSAFAIVPCSESSGVSAGDGLSIYPGDSVKLYIQNTINSAQTGVNIQIPSSFSGDEMVLVFSSGT